MSLSIRASFATATTALAIGWAAPPAAAQSDDPDDEDPSFERDTSRTKEGIEGGAFDDYETAEEKRREQDKPEYGIGVRFRTVFVPKPVFELFVEEASSGLFTPGFGLELARRKDRLEVVLGFEYESLSPDDGFWLDKGDDPNVAAETPDFLEFDDLAWVTADVAFLYNAPLGRRASFRVGGGVGIGLLLGEILQTDSTCVPGTDDIRQDCTADPVAMEGRQFDDPADLPPVFPVVNLIMGLQWRPVDKLTFNLETGLRTVGFVGLSSTLYL